MSVVDSYRAHARRLLGWRRFFRLKNRADAMAQAVGGSYDEIGKLEFELLRQVGLLPHHNVVDIGCGSGRLTTQLRDYLKAEVLGIDVVPELVAYAEERAARKDWSFQVVAGTQIPAPNRWADYVCFFSVFTHLLHEESYRYLLEAKRVLRPGGKVVFSFLEFGVPAHWVNFDNAVKSKPGEVRNQFLSRDAIEAWAEHLQMQHQIEGPSPLGQSVCVLAT